MSQQARVGLFVLTALFVLVGFVFILGDVSFQATFDADVDFAFAGGLQAGAPVKVSGVKIGRVDEISLLYPEASPQAAAAVPELGRRARPVVRVRLELQERARPLLTDGTRFWLGTQGIIGETYVEAALGAPNAASLDFTQPQRGVDAPALHVMALQVAALLDTFGQVAGSESGLGPALARLLDTTNEVLSAHRDELSRAVVDMSASAAELRVLLGELRSALGDGRLTTLVENASATAATLERDLPPLLARAKDSAAAIDALSTRVERNLDEATLLGIISDTKATTQTLLATAKDGQALMTSIKRGEGTIGGLVQDPQLYDDLKEMLRDLKNNPWKVFWRD